MSISDGRTSGQSAATTVSLADAGATQMTSPIPVLFLLLLRDQGDHHYTVCRENTTLLYILLHSKLF